jgi:hypothetical protein
MLSHAVALSMDASTDEKNQGTDSSSPSAIGDPTGTGNSFSSAATPLVPAFTTADLRLAFEVKAH